MKSVSRVGWWETLAQNSWFLVGNNIIHHIHSKDCQLGLNLKQKWIYSGGAYDADVSKFIGDTPHDIKVTPLGRRKWIDRKIKNRHHSKNYHSGIDNNLRMFIEEHWRGGIFTEEAHSHTMSGIPPGPPWDGARSSTLDFITSSNSVVGMVSRCSSPILRELSGSSIGKTGMIAMVLSSSSSWQMGIFQ
ncbi:hypothetical protein Tco_0854809 [Tanacetum coccineum]